MTELKQKQSKILILKHWRNTEKESEYIGIMMKEAEFDMIENNGWEQQRQPPSLYNYTL